MFCFTVETIAYATEFVEEIRSAPATQRDALLDRFHRELIELRAIHEVRALEANRPRSLVKRALSRIRTAVEAYQHDVGVL